MVEFVRKFEIVALKLLELPLFITKSINLLNFILNLILYDVSVPCDRRRFSVHSSFIEKSMCLTIPAKYFLTLTDI